MAFVVYARLHGVSVPKKREVVATVRARVISVASWSLVNGLLVNFVPPPITLTNQHGLPDVGLRTMSLMTSTTEVERPGVWDVVELKMSSIVSSVKAPDFLSRQRLSTRVLPKKLNTASLALQKQR